MNDAVYIVELFCRGESAPVDCYADCFDTRAEAEAIGRRCIDPSDPISVDWAIAWHVRKVVS